MNTINKLTSLAMVAVIGMWGCSSNQFASSSGESYDDLYGSSASVQVAARSNSTYQQDNRYANPDYQETNPNIQNGQNTDYYDESYMTSRNMPRRLSDDVGYNSGFREGYYAGQSSGFFPGSMNFGSYWPMAGSAFNVGFQMGLSRSLRFGYSPFNYGMGFSPFGYGSGYSPYGFGSYGFSPFGYSGYDSFGYSPFGYSPFGYGSMAYGYGGYGYSPFGFGGFGGYNPYYGGFGNQLIVVNNNYDQGRAARSYGPRSSVTRNNDNYNGDFNNSVRTSRNNGGRESYTTPSSGYTTRGGTATSSDSYYARPRANSSGTYYNGDGQSVGRTSGESRYSGRSSATSTSDSRYYSAPRSSTNSSYSTESTNRSSRTYNSGSTYNQSRGNNTNSTYQSQNQSSWQNNSRSNTTTPTYNSNSSRGATMSAPSSAPASSGSSAPRSRGPR